MEDYAFIDLTKVQIDHVISILLLALASSEADGSRREIETEADGCGRRKAADRVYMS